MLVNRSLNLVWKTKHFRCEIFIFLKNKHQKKSKKPHANKKPTKQKYTNKTKPTEILNKEQTKKLHPQKKEKRGLIGKIELISVVKGHPGDAGDADEVSMTGAVLPWDKEGSFKFGFASLMTLSASVELRHPLFSCIPEMTQ